MKSILFQSRSIKWPETQFFPLPLNFNPFVSETRKKSSISGFLIDGQKIFHWEGSFQYRTNWSMQKKIGHNGNSIEKSLHDFIRAFNWSTSSVAPQATKKLRDRHVKILWQIIGEEKRKFGKSRFPKNVVIYLLERRPAFYHDWRKSYCRLFSLFSKLLSLLFLRSNLFIVRSSFLAGFPLIGFDFVLFLGPSFFVRFSSFLCLTTQTNPQLESGPVFF